MPISKRGHLDQNIIDVVEEFLVGYIDGFMRVLSKSIIYIILFGAMGVIMFHNGHYVPNKISVDISVLIVSGIVSAAVFRCFSDYINADICITGIAEMLFSIHKAVSEKILFC